MARKNIKKGLSFINEYLIIIIVFLVPCFFAWGNNMYNVFELNKLVLFRILLYISIVITVFEILFNNFRINKNIKNGLFLSFFLLISFLLSTIFSISPSTGLWGNYYREQGFFTFFHYLVFFIIFLYKINSIEKVKRVMGAVVFSSFFVCLYGIAQAIGLDFNKWSEGAISTGRIFSSLGQPNFLGHYLVIVFPIAIYFLIVTKKLLYRALVLIVLFLQIICIILTYSRAAWLGLIVILAIIFVYVVYRLYRIKKFRIFLFSALLLIVIFITGLINYLSLRPPEIDDIKFFDRVKSITDLNYGSNKIRLYYWGAAINGFKEASLENKLFGYGLDASQYIFTKYYEPDWAIYETVNTAPDKAHNLILDILLQIGLIGLMAYLLLFIYIVRKSYIYLKNEKSKENRLFVAVLWLSLIGYFINNLFSFSTTTTYLYFFMFIGSLFVICSDKNEKTVLININISSFLKSIILIALIATLGVFTYYYNVNLYQAEKKLFLSLKQRTDRDCEGAIKSVQEARELYGVANYYDVFYVRQLSRCLEDNNFLNKLKKEDKNIEIYLDLKDDLNYSLINLLQVAYLKAQLGKAIDEGYYSLAENDFKEILKLNQNVPAVYSNMGRMFFLKKEYDKAIVAIKRAIAILPSTDNQYLNKDHKDEIKKELSNNYDILGSSYMIMGDLDEAILNFDKSLENDPYFLMVYKKRADAYYLKKDLDNTIKSLKRGLILSIEDYAWSWALAQIYKEKGDYRLAIQYAEMALEKKDSDNDDILKFIEDYSASQYE